VLFGMDYSWIGVVREDGRARIRAIVNGRNFDGPELTAPVVFLRAAMNDASEATVAYSLDGETFMPLGESLRVGRTWYEGIKFGLFTYTLSTDRPGGSVDFDFFRYRHDGPAGKANP